MSGWREMDDAPRDGQWIEAPSEIQEPLYLRPDPEDEEGWWQDGTGDYYVEARFNNGNGISQWRPTAEGFRPEDMGWGGDTD